MMGMRMTLLLRLIKYPALSTAVNARGEHLLEMLIGEYVVNKNCSLYIKLIKCVLQRLFTTPFVL